MKQDFTANAEKLIEYLGGIGNILSAGNCMTRLRVSVRDEGKVDEKKLASAEDVLGLIHDRQGCYEIVVGPGKSRKYADLFRKKGVVSGDAALSGNMSLNGQAAGPYDKDEGKGISGGQALDWKDNKKKLQAGRKDSPVKSALKLIGEIFVPLIPGTITAGLCAGFAALIAQAVPDFESIKPWSIVHSLLTLVNASFMTYITAWAGYRAAERFGATPIIGGMLGFKNQEAYM